MFADTAYLAFVGQLGGEPFDRLRGIATLNPNPLYLLVRRGSAIRQLADLQGRRVGVGRPGASIALTAKVVLETFHLDVEESDAAVGDALAAMAAGELDALFVGGVSAGDQVRSALAGNAEVLPFSPETIARLQRRHPFMRGMVIPRDLARGAPGLTIGLDGLAGVPERARPDIVYGVTKAFFQALPELSAFDTPPLRQMNPRTRRPRRYRCTKARPGLPGTGDDVGGGRPRHPGRSCDSARARAAAALGGRSARRRGLPARRDPGVGGLGRRAPVAAEPAAARRSPGRRRQRAVRRRADARHAGGPAPRAAVARARRVHQPRPGARTRPTGRSISWPARSPATPTPKRFSSGTASAPAAGPVFFYRRDRPVRWNRRPPAPFPVIVDEHALGRGGAAAADPGRSRGRAAVRRLRDPVRGAPIRWWRGCFIVTCSARTSRRSSDSRRIWTGPAATTFPALLDEAASANRAGEGMAISISDERGEPIAGAGSSRLVAGAPTSDRTFPLMFFNPVIAAAEPPASCNAARGRSARRRAPIRPCSPPRPTPTGCWCSAWWPPRRWPSASR